MTKNNEIKLTQSAQKKLVEILTKPSKSTTAMNKLKSLPKLEVREYQQDKKDR